ncbi:hypothetical protein RCL47_25500, partial [Salmonella enterica subsp. enterica serovar 1,4,[5],12:i:-]
MTPSQVLNSHADAVNEVPPSETLYLSANTASAEERWAAQAYPDLGSQAVLAVALRFVAGKNNPMAYDLQG